MPWKEDTPIKEISQSFPLMKHRENGNEIWKCLFSKLLWMYIIQFNLTTNLRKMNNL